MATLPVLVGSDEDWTPSTYAPDWRVEIAFNAGYVTPSADRVWTDVSEWVELHENIDISVGRQDERSTADANDLTLTLDNKDGRFTALRAASPYYPNVKVGRPIRVSAMTQTGHTSVRFVGFIDGWPVEWDGSDAYAKASIRATSRLARLGLTAGLKSMIENEILASEPAAYWSMGDPAGATSASESSGNGGNPLAGVSGVATFGDDSAPASGGTVAAFADSGSLNASLSGLVPTGIHMAVKLNALPSSLARVARLRTADGKSLTVDISSGGVLSVDHDDMPAITGPVFAVGETHDIAISITAGIATLYVDGVFDDDESLTITSTATSLEIGSGLTGTVAHVTYYDTSVPAITAVDAAAMSDAVLTGFAGDTTDERLLRILSWAGVASAEVDAETGSETMTYQETQGASVVDALREVEATEGGVLFDGRDGRIAFHGRAHRYLAAPAATLDMAAQHVESDYAPRLDRSTLVNDVTVSNPTTGESARQVDTTSSDEYGIATGSATSVADSYFPLTEKASWQIALYSEPRMRCPSLTVDVLAHVGLSPSAETLLDVTVGSLLAVINAPTQSDTTTPSYFVEGYTESIGGESYRITYNLSPTYPMLDVFVLDSATRGVLGTDILAY